MTNEKKYLYFCTYCYKKTYGDANLKWCPHCDYHYVTRVDPRPKHRKPAASKNVHWVGEEKGG